MAPGVKLQKSCFWRKSFQNSGFKIVDKTNKLSLFERRGLKAKIGGKSSQKWFDLSCLKTLLSLEKSEYKEKEV